ncbi:MAG: general secretion pathway protein GspE, partial [Nitrospirota bacterium]|nr:general secretion pathway protein GspE [Nitrospirota bacterium]
MNFGEALIKEGLITRQQLDLALQRQVVFGGKIGTNLVELRILEEDELTKFLGKYFRVPHITPEMIDDIPEEVISSIDKEIIEKYRILPFKKVR